MSKDNINQLEEEQNKSDQPQEKAEKKEEKKEVKKDRQIKVSENEFNSLKEEVTELKDRNVRLFAEFENMRKRNERDRMEMIKYAHEEVIVDILGILDDFERSYSALNKEKVQDAEFIKGIEMVIKNIQELLKKYNVEPVNSVGSQFNPDTHEVLFHEETTEHDDGIIIEEYQKGFKLGDKVVRTAKVKVAKNNSQ